jgi:chemotaxis protein MotB
VTQVRGYADQFLRVKNNPYDPSNRRITILVKNREGAAPPKFAHAGVVGGAPAGANPGAPSAGGAQNPPSSAPPASPKPAASPPSKPGLMGKLSSLLPGAKR